MRSFRFRESMLVRLCTAVTALAALGVSPPPEPAASEAPTPLKEIGRVRASVCSTIVVHANSAIDDALSNDADLHALIGGLTTAKLDDATELQKHNAFREFEQAAAKLRETAIDGEAEVRRLRALAAESPEPRKSELKAFADALGGALYRQRTMAIDAQRLLAVQQGRADSAASELTFAQHAAPAGRPDIIVQATPGPLIAPGYAYDKAFRLVAADFVERTKLVAVDEGVAADHSLGATTGC
jgi:hypothetical protein